MEINTYSACSVGLTPASSCTDIASISGTTARRIEVLRVRVSGVATADDSTPVILVKRSTLNTSGTPTVLTNVPHSSKQPASIAIVTTYAANPTLGTIVGNLQQTRLVLAKVAASGGLGAAAVEFDLTRDGRGIYLLTAAETLAINLGAGSVPSGAAIDIGFVWTEVAL